MSVFSSGPVSGRALPVQPSGAVAPYLRVATLSFRVARSSPGFRTGGVLGFISGFSAGLLSLFPLRFITRVSSPASDYEEGDPVVPPCATDLYDDLPSNEDSARARR
ncbi:MAG: hypothetical protein OXF02_07605 [Simkaniaceae bacterium]|nr:hypothetical protein [Simkaniaceae bacterium]